MELVPRPLSERVVRGVLGSSVAMIAALCTAFALDVAGASCVVTVTTSLVVGAFAIVAVRDAYAFWIPVVASLLATYALAFGLHDHAGRDATAACVGAVFAAILIRPISRMHATTRIEGALDRFECVSITAGRSLFVVGVVAFLLREPALRAVSAVAATFGLALLGHATLRDRARVRFLRSVYAKEEPSYRIERDTDVRGYELLPPVLSGTITSAVIAHVNASPDTYRTSGGPRPLARVTSTLPGMLVRIEKRTRFAATLVGAFLSTTAVIAVTPFDWGTGKPAVAHAAVAPLEAPACRDARPYFSDEIQTKVDGIARATLLTGTQDPSIAPGAGVLVIVPTKGHAISDYVRARSLALAHGAPCKDKLSLRVEEAVYRSFAIDVTLVIEPGADEAAVRRDADEQVRELFERDARAVYNEHFAFGDAEKTFGYRIRHALRHVLGVKSVRLLIDGADKEVPLGPRDFPELASLAVHTSR